MLVLALAGAVETAYAQRIAATEFATGAVATLASNDFWGGEGGIARRAGTGRVAVSVAAGSVAGAAAVRARATGEFLLRPRARSGMSPYGGVGVAWAGAEDARGAAYLAVLAGLEAAPARPRGWYVEIGLEGGLRLAAGLRWRRLKLGN